MAMLAINPTTEQVINSYEETSSAQLNDVLDRAQEAFRRWRSVSFDERATYLREAARILRKDKDRWASLMTQEMGKPIVEAEGEILKSAWNCDHYAEHAARYLAPELVETNASESYAAFEPLGVVLEVMPWNFPFWQAIRQAAPLLMAGNAAILKHASNVPGCALAIEEVFTRAGLPKGLFQTVLVPGSQVESLIEDRRIQAVTLTGSSEVGEKVASAAGRQLKKQVLELGGSDPFIVLADADLDLAAATAARARTQNSGQSCICAKRFIVEQSVADEFADKFVVAVRKLQIGDPMERTTNIGPLARADLRDTLAAQVESTLAQGARAILGGTRLNGKGYYYTPTILDGVTSEMTAFREETFGPVAAIVRARDAEEAILLGNDHEYGLGASIWTRDVERGKQLARRVEAGNVFINGLVGSDPRLPFGGVKRSGYGRELSYFGIREFTNIMTVWVGPATGPQLPTPPAD